MGAGPAGLSAADELARNGVECAMLEKDPATVGGIARTVEHLGCRFDVGPHRFFSKSGLIEERWKVWGVHPSELSADWAAQRIKGLNLFEAVRSALLPARGGQVIKTLIDRFHFPRRGAGQMWERVAELQRRRGTPIEMGAEVVRVNHDRGRATSVEARTADGGRQTWQADHFISSLPIRELVASFSP